jgi:hypothetical protein
VEGELEGLKPHQEGLLLPIIHEHRRRYVGPDGPRPDLMATLAGNHGNLPTETMMAVAIVSFVLVN